MIDSHAMVAAASWVLAQKPAGFPAALAQLAQTASPAAAQALAQALIDAMWQGAAVALGLYLALRLAPRVGAAHRFAAWTAAFALVAALPFASLAAHLLAGSGAAAAISGAPSSARPWLELDSRWALGLAVLWLAGSALRLGDLIFHTLRLRSLWKSATPVADEAANQALAIRNGGSRGLQAPETAQNQPGAFRHGDVLKGHGFSRADNLGTIGGALAPEGRPFEICTTRDLDRPSVIGFFAPRILIPEWLYARLTPQELRQVVLHEVEHLCRHDDWTNLIQKFALVLFPLNPALAWIERRLCREREMACDEGVVRRTQAPRAYAACLASLAERGIERNLERRAAALSLAAWRRRPELVHRVHGILGRKPALSPAASGVLLGVLGCGLLAGSVELARCPQAVGFVASAQPEMAQAGAVNIDRPAYMPVSASGLASGASSYRMVQARAILTSSRNQAQDQAMISTPTQTLPAIPRPAAAAESEVASRDGSGAQLRVVSLRAATPSAAVVQDVRQTYDAPQFFVLTTAERVQMLSPNGREIADYDTGSAAVGESAMPQRAANEYRLANAPEIVVTRLIVRIEPGPASSGQANVPGQGSPSKSTTDSKPVQQRAIIPFGNGWLVFQL